MRRKDRDKLNAMEVVCAAIQLAADNAQGTMGELDRLYDVASQLDRMLKENQSGYCAGVITEPYAWTAFCYVAHPDWIDRVMEVVQKIVPDAVIASKDNTQPASLQHWVVHHPAGGKIFLSPSDC